MKFMISMAIGHYDQEMEELVGGFLPREKMVEYQRLSRLRQLHTTALERGWEEFSWKRAHDEGQLCENDYEVFPEQLKGLTPEDYRRKREAERNKK